MKKLFLLTTASLLGAAGAQAQTTSPSVPGDAATTPGTMTESPPATTGAATMTDTPSAPSTETTTVTTATPDPNGNVATVERTTTTVATPAPAVAATGLASFDVNNDGALTPAEFGQMVVATDAAGPGGSKSKSANLANSTRSLFAKADINRDRRITGDELAAWQAGG